MTNRFQQTLANKVSFIGKGLHSGRFVRMDILPAGADSGIVFERTDTSWPVKIKAVHSNLTDSILCTTISNGVNSVATIEHLCAAFAGLQIDNALIKLNGPEVPIMDGSAFPFLESIKTAGIKRLGLPRKMFLITKKFEVRDGDRFIKAEPSCFSEFCCSIYYANSIIGAQTIDYDPALSGNRGYVSMIPKHLKCQRVYTPTPLATLTKLTVRLQRPDGSLLSDTLDTLDVSGIFFSNSAATYINGAYTTVSNSYYQDTSGEFIWIDTNTNFSRFTVAQGDRIVIRNLSISNPTVAQTDFLTYLQRASGHIVVNIAYMKYVSGSPKQQIVTDGANQLGYARFIIIRNQFRDPTTGAITLLPFGGQATNTALGSSLVTLNFSPGRLLNLSHQTQLIFRVITRDYDSTSLVRPDNL